MSHRAKMSLGSTGLPRFAWCPIVVITLAILSCATVAQEPCPSSIQVESQIVTAPSVWQAVARPVVEPGLHYLDSVAFISGPPERGAFLRPTTSNELSAAGERQERYEFSPGTGDIWLACMYRETRQMLVMPVVASYCTVVLSERPDEPVKSISCSK